MMWLILIGISACVASPGQRLGALRASAGLWGGEGTAAPAEDQEALWLEDVAALREHPPHAPGERTELEALLAWAAGKHPSPAVRCAAVLSLGEEARQLGDRGLESSVNAALLGSLRDGDNAVRVAAAGVVLDALGPAVIDAYGPLLGPGTTPPVRVAALRALAAHAQAWRDNEAILAAIHDNIDHGEPGVSFHARRALALMIGLPGDRPGSKKWWHGWWRRHESRRRAALPRVVGPERSGTGKKGDE